MGNVSGWLLFAAVIIAGVCLGLFVLVVVGFPTQHEKVECPYEKYFENKGGGVYHLEIDRSVFFVGEEELDTTQTTAKIVACWREAHKNEFRIVGITYALHVQFPPYIIITEPK